jgi:putative hydrolase of the HAD superfamily
MIKNIIFDLGGVVFKEDWSKLNEEMIENYRISILVRSEYGKEINNLYDQTTLGKKDISELFKLLCKKSDVSKICQFYKDAYSRNKLLNRSLIKFIESLRKKYYLICLTDTNRLHLMSHKEQGITKLFDKCFTSFDLKGRKQQKETFLKVLKNLSINPKETLFIDDSQINLNIAKSIGINTILFNDTKETINKIERFLI